MISGMKLQGRFIMDCYDKHGNHKWHNETENMVVNEGLDHALNVILNVDTQVDPWYIAMFNTNTTPLATMTYATPVYTETTNYDEAVRQAYVDVPASSQSITNSASRAVFTMNTTETIYGAALVSINTKGDTVGAGGILFCAALFTNAKSVNDDDTLEVTYTIGAADDGA
jgi:hypothetical protein